MAVKLGKKQKGKAQVAEQKSAKKAKKVEPVKQESSEEESSSEEEEEMEVVQQVAPAKKTPAKKTPAKKTPAKKTPAKQAPAKKTPAKKAPVEAEDDSDEDDSEEEEEPPAKAAKGAKGAKAAKAKQPEPEEDDEDDSDEDESDEEEEQAPKETAKQAKTKQVEIDEDDEEDDDDDDDDDSEEEEEPTKVQQVKGAKKAAGKAKVEEEEDDDEEDSDEEDDDDDEDEEEEAAPPMKKKKMAGGDAKTTKTDDNDDVGGEVISIFIGGVRKGTSDSEVEDFFTSQGVQVMNARVIPNKAFAYVDVASEKMYKKAMELNHQELSGSEIRLERGKSKGEKAKQDYTAAGPTGSRDDSNNRTLFIKGLCFDTSQQTLQDKFKCKEVRMPLKNGRPAGYAYLEFDNADSVEKAMTTMQGSEIDGWNVILDYVGDKSKNKRPTQGASYGGSQTLHIKGLTDGVTEHDLKEKLGAVEVRRPNRRDDPNSKVDFAYADFASEDAAKQALDNNQGASLKDAFLTLDFAKSKRSDFGGGEVDRKTLYIRGLSWETTQDRLQSAMEADSVRIPYDRDTNQPKGFAYAEYSSESEASAAMSKLNGSDLDGYTLSIDYAKPRTSFGSPRGGRGNFGGGFRGGRGGRGGGGGGFGGGRGGGGRGGGGRGGRGGGFRGGRGGRGGGFGEYKGKRTSFD